METRNLDQAATLLQRARLELGWKQSRVLSLLASEAKQRRLRIASPTSLKTMLSRWENGLGRPDETYQRLFCAIYERDPDELGFVEQEVSNSAIAPTLDSEAVEYFQCVFDQHIRADNLMGPHHLVDVVRAQAALLDQMLPSAKDNVRKALLTLACRYNEFTGWLYQDAGDPVNAMTYSDKAMDYALALNDPVTTAYILMRKSNIASDLGHYERSLGLTSAGLRSASNIPPRIRALLLGQQARAYALRGAKSDCTRSIDDAMTQVNRPDADSDEVAPYCTPAYMAMQTATCWNDLGSPDLAIPVFEKALSAWPRFLRRDKGMCLARLAVAHATRGDKASACRVGHEAANTVRSATSARALRDLRLLRERLVPWRRDEEVSELRTVIRGLTHRA